MAQWKQPQGGKSLPKPGPGSGDAQLKDETFQDRNENEKYCANQQGIKFPFLKNLHSLLFVQTLPSIKTRVGHADASADAHRMRINAHRCASSAYWAKNEIPFFTYKLPFWLR